jgi:hypothetical protein
MEDDTYKPNRMLIMLLINSLVIFVIIIVSMVIFNLPLPLLEITLFIIIIASAHLVYKDAQKLRAGDSGKGGIMDIDSWSPTIWGLAVLFLWIVRLPLYLIMREGIFWQNQPPSYDEIRPTSHMEMPVKYEPRPPKSVVVRENVIYCPNCDTLWSKRQYEQSSTCRLCGEVLKIRES